MTDLRLLLTTYILGFSTQLLTTFCKSCKSIDNIYIVFLAFGVGYAWNPSTLEIKLGDIVRWSWTTSSFVVGIGFRVQQTESPLSLEYNGQGFNSGVDKSANG